MVSNESFTVSKNAFFPECCCLFGFELAIHIELISSSAFAQYVCGNVSLGAEMDKPTASSDRGMFLFQVYLWGFSPTPDIKPCAHERRIYYTMYNVYMPCH